MRGKVRAGADGAGDLADGHDFPDPFKAFERAAKLVIHERQLEAECGWFSLDAVAASNTWRELVFPGALRNGGSRGLHVGDEQVGALHHLDGVAGVAHVAAGQAEVEPAAGLVVDLLGDGGGEADDIVIQCFLQLALAGDETGQVGEPFVAARPDLCEVLRGHNAFLDQRLTGEEFDLEPELELVFVGPDGPHLGARVARNHRAEIRRSWELSRGTSVARSGGKRAVPRGQGGTGASLASVVPDRSALRLRCRAGETPALLCGDSSAPPEAAAAHRPIRTMRKPPRSTEPADYFIQAAFDRFNLDRAGSALRAG